VQPAPAPVAGLVSGIYRLVGNSKIPCCSRSGAWNDEEHSLAPMSLTVAVPILTTCVEYASMTQTSKPATQENRIGANRVAYAVAYWSYPDASIGRLSARNAPMRRRPWSAEGDSLQGIECHKRKKA
jgi:hypothetical protein